jgi:uncharacterized membrane protein YhaH (DUF805 family)
MNFLEAVKSGFSNYVNFSGRAVRSEFWYWTLFTIVLVGVLGVIDQMLNPGVRMGAFSILNGLVSLALILPGLAVSIRRLHDIDRTGWWVLLSFIPIIGILVLIYWACQPGTSGPNRFGPDPMPALSGGSGR